VDFGKVRGPALSIGPLEGFGDRSGHRGWSRQCSVFFVRG
jgi:hypothetical protein